MTDFYDGFMADFFPTRKDSILDTGKYWFRLGLHGQKALLLKTTPCLDYKQKISMEKWEKVQVGSQTERVDKKTLKRVDDFFGTAFCQIFDEKKSAQIFRTEQHFYRVTDKNGSIVLQRCEPPGLHYNNLNISSENYDWHDVHAEQKLLIPIDSFLLTKLEKYFNAYFSTKKF